MKRASPIFLLILGLLAGFPAARLTTATAAKPEPPAKTEPAAQAEPAQTEPAAVADQASLDSQNCKPEAPKGPGAATATATSGTAAATATASPPAPLPAWCMPVRLLRDFFGLPAVAEKTRRESLKEIVDRAKAEQYDLRFMVALVPALPDPRMDQALDAIQRGFASIKASGYLLDRAWLPWAGTGDKPADPLPPTPGLLLFRGSGPSSGPDSRPRVLEMVFLVPETSKMGIQKDAFREALYLITDLRTAAVDPGVAILGPSYSGSVESLRMALLSWGLGWGKDRGNPLSFRAASGSASADGLEETLAKVGVSFCRMTLPDSVLLRKTFQFLSGEMGWDLRKVGLLVEDDTQYGQGFANPYLRSAAEKDQTLKPVLFTFPSHLADLRNAWEDLQKQENVAAGNPVPPTRRVLGLDLSGQEREADLVPTFSSTTTAGNDLLFSNLLQTIGREGIRYVGIVATDPKDKLFLAEKLRELAPDVVLFTFDNNLLYAHPDYTEEMSGMLVLSSYPLFTEGAPGFPRLRLGSEKKRFGRQHKQFGSEYQEGIYQAVRYLLGSTSVPDRQAWIAAVGNGSLWPVAQLPVDDPKELGDARFCGPGPDPKAKAPDKKAVAGFDDKDDLQILLIAALLCLMATGLRRAALLDKISRSQVDSDGWPVPVPPDSPPFYDMRGNRALLVIGTGLLAVGAGVLLAVSTIPLWLAERVALMDLAWRPSHAVYLLILAVPYGWLVWKVARASRDVAPASREERLGLKAGALWGIGGLAAFALLVLGVFQLCVPGGQTQLFYLRAREFSSGLSPLVPLAALTGAIYLWIWNELKRRRLQVRLASDCPLEPLCEPALTGSSPILQSLHGLLSRTWRVTDYEMSWILPALAFVPAAVLLWSAVQPIGEARAFGRLFILLVLAAYALSALSFYRFVRLWRETLRVLHRLDNSSPAVAKAFKAISKDLDWRPIKSFGWHIPPFRSLTLSVQKLRELEAAGKVTLKNRDDLERALQGVFENEQEEGSAPEIANRNTLEQIFSWACGKLHGKLRDGVDDPAVRRFLALRVAAYLRFVFAHLRNCLISALASGLLALLGVAAYAFEPKHLVYLGGWVGLAIAVALTLWIFLQMDCNPTLSRIGGTKPGQVTFDRAFLSKLATYVGVPVLGLVATLFPAVGQLLSRVASQVLRVVGGG